MASNDGKSLSGDDLPDTPPNDASDPTVTVQSMGYSMHMYPFPSHVLPQQQPPRSKRRQVKNACTNCQKACKKCDDARPCLRCVKYGVSEECIDSQRKERKKGIKRGPYKKRDGKGSSSERPDVSSQDLVASNNGPSPSNGSPSLVGPFMPVPGFYGQYPTPHMMKPVDGPHLYPQYMSVPQPLTQGGAEGEHNGYPPVQQYYPAFVPFGSPPVYPYMVPRHDGQIQQNYMVFPMYPKVSGPGDMGPIDQVRQEGRGGEEGSDKVG
ncbi:hypothetical protein J132_10348 [Termitomyces sp. J132]|nr:hypothetical protein C0989_006141 [Termitomyces sp. Mn162]KAH0584152.1 hypothetical protein H2248_009712 [Termitomyces sp. 'cryptogamus']KNZ79382.1 hypothetical protein J132_10348 [Termitomyces sp. J132]